MIFLDDPSIAEKANSRCLRPSYSKIIRYLESKDRPVWTDEDEARVAEQKKGGPDTPEKRRFEKMLNDMKNGDSIQVNHRYNPKRDYTILKISTYVKGSFVKGSFVKKVYPKVYSKDYYLLMWIKDNKIETLDQYELGEMVWEFVSGKLELINYTKGDK